MPFASHRFPKPDVVGMVGVGSAIPVVQQAVIADGIVVGSRLAFLHRHRGDAQRQAADPRVEDPLRSLKWNSLTFKGEATLQFPPVEQV